MLARIRCKRMPSEQARASVLPSPWDQAVVTVVVPTFNEADNLPGLADALFGLPLPNLRIVVVDDDSPDGTGALADAIAERVNTRAHPRRMTVVHHAAKGGLGRAYVDGMTRALEDGAEYVVQMDADGSHDPADVPRMLGVLLATGAGVVVGSRYVQSGALDREWDFGRRLLSAWANLYTRGILGLRVRDMTAGFKLWRRRVLLDVGLGRIRSDGYAFQVEMTYVTSRLGHTMIEIPIYFAERRVGQSKMSLRVKLESAVMPWLLARRYRDVRPWPHA